MRKFIAVMLAVFLLAGFTTMAFADDIPSPTTQVHHRVQVIYELNPPITAATVDVDDGETYRFTAREFEGFEFDRFEIDGEYEIVFQDGATIEIRPITDVVIHVFFKNVEPGNDPHDPSPVSPHTGTNLYWIIGIMMFAVVGVVFATKKLIRDR